MTDHPDQDAAEITRIRADIQARIDRGQELNRLLVDNLACAAQLLESCRQAMKRLDFTQATIDAHISEDHRLIAHRLAVEVRRLNTEIDLERQYLRYLRTTNHQQRPARSARGNTAAGSRAVSTLAARATRHANDRIYDHGTAWCDRRDQHPAPTDGYPGPDHYPAECRTSGGQFHDGRLDTYGQPVIIEAYAARPFRFGQPRQHEQPGPDHDTRLVLSAVGENEPGTAALRLSMPITEVRNLAHHLLHLADVIDGHIPQGHSATPARPSSWGDDRVVS